MTPATTTQHSLEQRTADVGHPSCMNPLDVEELLKSFFKINLHGLQESHWNFSVDSKCMVSQMYH